MLHRPKGQGDLDIAQNLCRCKCEHCYVSLSNGLTFFQLKGCTIEIMIPVGTVACEVPLLLFLVQLK